MDFDNPGDESLLFISNKLDSRKNSKVGFPIIQCIAKIIEFLNKRQNSTVPSSFVSAEWVKMPNKTS